MADSAVAITAGTGTSIDTRTEATNGNHRQVVVLGDPATNAGVAPVDATAGLKVDLGADNDITGTVTANLSATDNAVLDAIEVDTTTIAGAVAGSEMQVDVVGALPAGTNAIGKLAANSGVDIGDVDVTSVIPGTGATNLGKAIDTATGATDTGVLALATRDDALSTLTPIEGDNVQLRTTSTGALWVTQSGTVTVDGSGVTQPVSNAGLTELAAAINASSQVDVNIAASDISFGGTSAADDADFTATTTPGTPAMGVYESTPTSVTDGDLGTVGITSGRRLKTSATIDAALPAGTNNIGDVDVLSSALPTGASTSANQTTIIGHLDGVEGLLTTIDADTSNLSVVGGGTEAAAIRVTIANNSTGVLSVDDNGGALTVDGTVTADLGATDNAVLDSIAAATAATQAAVEGTLTVTGGGGGTEYTEDVASANPQVGKAIMVERDDALSAVTPIEGDWIGLRGTAEGALWTQDFNSDAILADTTAILADTASMDTNLGTVAGAVSGTEMQVDIVSAPTLTVNAHAVTNAGTFAVQSTLQAGTAYAGKVRLTDGTTDTDIRDLANSNALNVAIVDGSGDHITSIGGGTQYTEDAAAAADPVGTASMLIRSDTPATQVTTDGDNIAQRGTNYGAAYVQLVTSSGSYIDSVGGGTEYTEDVASANPIVGKAILMERDDALTAVTPIEGDWIGLRGTAEGALWTQDFNSDAILADTTAIKTAVETIDNAISGSEMQVDVLTMPTVTVTATNLDVQSGGADLATSTQAGAIQTAVEIIDNAVHVDDAAYTLGTHSGVMMMGFAGTQSVNANDAGAIAMETDGSIHIHDGGNTITVDGTVTANLSATDNAVLDAIEADTTTIAGAISGTEMQVDVLTMPTVTVNAHAVTNAGTFVVQENGAALTALQLIDDSVATLGTTTYTEAATKGLTIGAVRRDADTTLVDTTNEIGPLQMDANGRLKVEAFSGETLPVSLTSTTVTGTVAVTQSGTWDEVGINDSGNSITVDYATTGSGTATGALRVELPTNGTGVIATVGAVTSITNALPAGTNAIGKLAANSGVDIGDVTLTAGTAAIGTLLPPDIDVTTHTNYTKKYYTNAGAVTDGIVWSPAAGKRWHIHSLFVNVSAAATVTFEDDKAGGDEAILKMELAANSGTVIPFPEKYPLASGEDAADLIVTTSAGNVYITAVGYEI